MLYRCILLFVVLCSALNGCTVAEHHLDKESDRAVQIAYQHIKQHTSQFADIEPENNLLLKNYKKDQLGFQHLRFQQISQQIPVWPQELIVHINRENQVYRVDGELFKVPQFTLPPKLTPQDAMLKAINNMDGQWTAKNSELYIYQHKQASATLAYRVEINQSLFRQFIFINANSGVVITRIEGSPSKRLFDE